MKRIAILILVFGLLLLSAYTVLKNEIVDAWRDEDGIFIEFFKNGTLLITDEQGTNITGTYQFIDKNTIEINFSGALAVETGSQIMDVAIEEDTLTLSRGEGALILTR